MANRSSPVPRFLLAGLHNNSTLLLRWHYHDDDDDCDGYDDYDDYDDICNNNKNRYLGKGPFSRRLLQLCALPLTNSNSGLKYYDDYDDHDVHDHPTNSNSGLKYLLSIQKADPRLSSSQRFLHSISCFFFLKINAGLLLILPSSLLVHCHCLSFFSIAIVY